MQTYPICLVWLDQRRSLVIGGGNVAVRKAVALLDAGAVVTAISPKFHEEFYTLSQNSALTLVERPYQPGDLEGAFLVVSATDSTQVNYQVYQEALQRGCLVNVVDDPQHSNFIVPAVVRRGEVAAAVTTGGASPALARRLREGLEDWLRPGYGELAQILGELRPELIRRFSAGSERLEAALCLVDSDLLDILERDGLEAGRSYASKLLEQFSGGHTRKP